MFAAAFDRHQMFAHLPGCEGNAGVACKLDEIDENQRIEKQRDDQCHKNLTFRNIGRLVQVIFSRFIFRVAVQSRSIKVYQITDRSQTLNSFYSSQVHMDPRCQGCMCTLYFLGEKAKNCPEFRFYLWLLSIMHPKILAIC